MRERWWAPRAFETPATVLAESNRLLRPDRWNLAMVSNLLVSMCCSSTPRVTPQSPQGPVVSVFFGWKLSKRITNDEVDIKLRCATTWRKAGGNRPVRFAIPSHIHPRTCQLAESGAPIRLPRQTNPRLHWSFVLRGDRGALASESEPRSVTLAAVKFTKETTCPAPSRRK